MKIMTIRSPRRGRDGEPGQSYTEWQQEWRDALIGREPFKAASCFSTGYLTRTDQLPREWATDYHATASHGRAFVVVSWETPIAWVDVDGNWVVPDVQYSQSTGRAQRRVLTTLDSMGKGYREMLPGALTSPRPLR